MSVNGGFIPTHYELQILLKKTPNFTIHATILPLIITKTQKMPKQTALTSLYENEYEHSDLVKALLFNHFNEVDVSPPPNEEELKAKAIEDMEYTLRLFQMREYVLLESHLKESPYYSLKKMAADFDSFNNDDLRSIKASLSSLESNGDAEVCILGEGEQFGLCRSIYIKIFELNE